ncbi:uncharacterized protein LTR77_009610 [Saxophila tyrrhenica]|uniref:Cation/H+ exchanger transmembrane domain-containing protein n=1 Tax=Saxophila tyrrhenica TaxID=1690608 RepID=A0AAV9NYV6_9PEZI|nr:hypothetical protein LTR77_009610 [Saxophila tyrrhenica]
MWKQIEPTPSHLTYLILSLFLISYTLFANFIRNRLHLSEPPLALTFGIIVGPRGLGWLTPNIAGVNGPMTKDPTWIGGWGWGDDIVQETSRVIVGIQVFSVGVELPKYYASRHWKSVAMLLGPVMTFGWLVCAGFVVALFKTDWPTALVVAACLTPTDPVLASSILSNSQFSDRIPKRLKDMLSAESGCNDGISFPFLYVGLSILTKASASGALQNWFLITVLWQCVFGTLIGFIIGTTFNYILKFCTKRHYIDDAGITVFYLLQAILCMGVGSTLGSDDFLVAFGAGYGFARDGWFSNKTHGVQLPKITDLLLNSAMFVYLGTILPWYAFQPNELTPWITPGRLVAFLILVLCFRRLPIVLATYKWIPDIRTLREALFCGHFGPMGLGGIFLAMEARAWLEDETSTPDPYPPHYGRPYTNREKAVYTVWPLVAFIVFGSTLVHGLSVWVMSAYSHLKRPRRERASFFAAETDPLSGMEHEEGDGGSIGSDSDESLP